jgi:hypothetical protein
MSKVGIFIPVGLNLDFKSRLMGVIHRGATGSEQEVWQSKFCIHCGGGISNKVDD